MGDIRFDAHLHELGERCPVENLQISLSLAWWIAADLIRRHPGELRVIETHPGGGQYTCISVYRVASSGDPLVVHMNVDPGAHLTPASWFRRTDGERFNWLEVLLTSDRREYVSQQLEVAEGLPAVATTPSTTSASIGPLVVAAFLERSVLGPARWSTANLVTDSDDGIGLRQDLLQIFPGLAVAGTLTSSVDDPAFGVWFIGPPANDWEVDISEPAFAVDTARGHMWRRELAEPIDLLDAYSAAGRSLDALVSAVCPPAF